MPVITGVAIMALEKKPIKPMIKLNYNNRKDSKQKSTVWPLPIFTNRTSTKDEEINKRRKRNFFLGY